MTAVAAARDAVAAATDSLRAAGCETPRLDAEVLVAAAAGVDRLELVANPDLGLEPAASRTLMGWVRRRARREPVAYIVGHKPFRQHRAGGRLARPDSAPGDRAARGGRGRAGAARRATCTTWAPGRVRSRSRSRTSGPTSRVTASDRSPPAVDVDAAQRRAARPGGRGARSARACRRATTTWSSRTCPTCARTSGTRWRPRSATTSRARRSSARRGRARRDPRAGRRGPGGTLLALEHAPDQAEAVREMLEEAETRTDLAGRERVTVGRA